MENSSGVRNAAGCSANASRRAPVQSAHNRLPPTEPLTRLFVAPRRGPSSSGCPSPHRPQPHQLHPLLHQVRDSSRYCTGPVRVADVATPPRTSRIVARVRAPDMDCAARARFGWNTAHSPARFAPWESPNCGMKWIGAVRRTMVPLTAVLLKPDPGAIKANWPKGQDAKPWV